MAQTTYFPHRRSGTGAMKPGSGFVLYSSKISGATMSLGNAPGSIALILIGTFL